MVAMNGYGFLLGMNSVRGLWINHGGREANKNKLLGMESVTIVQEISKLLVWCALFPIFETLLGDSRMSKRGKLLNRTSSASYSISDKSYKTL